MEETEDKNKFDEKKTSEKDASCIAEGDSENKESAVDSKQEEKHVYTENEIKQKKIMSKVNSFVESHDHNKESVINYYINYTYLGDNSKSIQVGRDVNGNITQEEGEKKKKQKEDIVYFLKSKEEVLSFIEKNSETTILMCALVLSLLEIVPLGHLYELSELLFSYIYPKQQDTEVRNDKFLSFDEMMKKLDALLTDGIKQNETGETKIKCVIFKNTAISNIVLETAYFSYPQLRSGIFSFLSRIKQEKKYNSFSVQIRKAYAKLAVLDFDYFHDVILPEFIKLTYEKDLLYLIFIIKALLLEDKYSRNIENLLNHWLTLKNSKLWIVVLQLYGQGLIKNFDRRISSVILDLIKFEWNQFINDIEYKDSERFNDLLFYAHIYENIAEILIINIADFYKEQKSSHEKFYFAIFFLILFHLDRFYVYEQYQKLIFVQAYANKKTRPLLYPLFQFIWNKNRENGFLRKELSEILQGYLKEADKKSYQWDYMINFFLFLSICNTEDERYSIDFVMKFFKKCYKENIYIAKEIGETILNRLKNRKIYGGNKDEQF